jgi:hypothetical protein
MDTYIIFYSEVKVLADVLDEIKSSKKAGPKRTVEPVASNGNAVFLAEGFSWFIASSKSYQHTSLVEMSRPSNNHIHSKM